MRLLDMCYVSASKKKKGGYAVFVNNRERRKVNVRPQTFETSFITVKTFCVRAGDK